jgi:hypothetical protein
MSDLNKEDLTLLMDSYRKQVELNTQVLTQQQNLISRMDSMIDIHRETCHNISKVADKIDKQEKDNLENTVKIMEKVSIERKESLKEHEAIKNRIYIALVGMVVIITNLIAIYLKK